MISTEDVFVDPRFVGRMAENVATENDLFLSAAHGLLENVQKLLSTGTVTATISLSISAAEFTLQVLFPFVVARGDAAKRDGYVVAAACTRRRPVPRV